LFTLLMVVKSEVAVMTPAFGSLKLAVMTVLQPAVMAQEMAVASPVEFMTATSTSEEVHVTWSVKSWVTGFALKVPMATYCEVWSFA
jgi:hypothetical protein